MCFTINSVITLSRFGAIPANLPAMPTDRRAAVRLFMDRKGLKTAPWCRDAKVRESTLRDFLSGRNATMTLDTLDKLAAAADATIAEMIGEKVGATARPTKDMVPIKSLEVRASMGGGLDVLEEPEGQPFFFRRAWIEKLLDGKPGQLRVITDLTGDSMLPTINNGDIGLVLMPGEDVKFQSGAIYALWDGNGLIVKRLESTVGDRQQLRVISDNSAIYQPYTVDADDVRIIGQLVWRGGAV